MLAQAQRREYFVGLPVSVARHAGAGGAGQGQSQWILRSTPGLLSIHQLTEAE